MKATYSVTQTDGLTPNPDLNFVLGSNQSSSVSMSVAQAIKVQVPNLSAAADWPCFHYGNTNNTPWMRNWYNSGTSSWVEQSTTAEYPITNYLSFYIPFSSWTKIYVCRSAEEEEKVPNMENGGYYFKLNRVPAKSEFESYTRITGRGNAEFIPVFYTGTHFNGSGTVESLDFLGLNLDTRFNFLSPLTDSIRTGEEPEIINPNGNKVSVQVDILSPGAKPPTLDERVTALESSVATMSSQLTAIASQVASMQTKLDRILSATSTFFVSR